MDPIDHQIVFQPDLGIHASATLGGVVGQHPGNQFLGVVFTDNAFQTKTLVALGKYFNSTSISLFRFGGGGSNYDPTTQTNYVPPPGGVGRLVAVHQELWNLTWFKSWCLSLTPRCTWEASLPGEVNNTQAAVHMASWYHKVLGFAPDFWEFGNEPKAWTDYGINQTRWSTTDNVTPSGPDYATMVKNYISAVSAIYPLDHFIGIEAGCGCNRVLVSAVAAMDAPLVSALAYHTYPILSGSNTSLTQFYGTLQSGTNLSGSVSRFQQNIVFSCTTSACANMPVEVGEYQAGPHDGFSPFLGTFAGAPYMAASTIQALYANVSRFNVFDSNQLFNISTGMPTFEGLLYQRILTNLTMGTDYAVTVSAPNVGGVYAILTKSGHHMSFFLVNTNTTYALSFILSSSVFPVSLTGSEYTWAAWQAHPLSSHGILIPSFYRIPPQGILLLNNF
jgi:hypothetical protein